MIDTDSDAEIRGPVATSTTCVVCDERAFFAISGRACYKYCTSGAHIQSVPFPPAMWGDRAEEFMLRCRRNHFVRLMGAIMSDTSKPWTRRMIDNPCGLGNSPYNRVSFAIGIIDSRLFKMGAMV